MTARNFYFGKDATIVTGSANFASKIATGYATYNLSSAQATTFGSLNTSLQAAYLAAIEPSTRTRPTILAKDQAIKAMRANAILLSKIIYASATVSDAQLVGLGLLPRATRSPIGPATVAPALEIGAVSGRVVNVRLHAAGSERRGILPGARGANLYSYVGAAAPNDSRDWHYEGTATRSIAKIEFPADVPNGATAWLSACWVSNRGASGPACEPVPVTIQGGATLPAAA